MDAIKKKDVSPYIELRHCGFCGGRGQIRRAYAENQDICDKPEIFFPQIFSGCYTFTEKLHYWQGKALLSRSSYAEYGIGVDAPKPAQIPIYFISGYYDYTTPVTQARKLYEALEAPDKAFYEFADSAHSPLWEENDAVLEVMRKYVG